MALVLKRAPFGIFKSCTVVFRRFIATTDVKANLPDSSFDSKYFLEFKKYLKNSEISYKDGHTCLHVECRLCTDSNKSTAYINKRTGTFICPKCNVKQLLESASHMYKNGKTLKELPNIKEHYYQLDENLIAVTEEACEKLGIKGLSQAVLNSLGALYNETNHCLHFPLRNVANKIVGEKKLYLSDKREETPQNSNSSGLLIYGPSTKNKAILVTNVMDFLALVIHRIEGYCVVCLPNHLNSLPQECLPNLECFKELILWFSFDSAGWDAARMFSDKMDEKRCLLIRPTDTEPCPLVAHRKRLNLRHILLKATPIRHKSITTFSALRNDILSELQNIEKVNGVKWKRFPILNKLLKGHRKGELTILTGSTGCGKTTFASEYSLDLAMQGVATLWGSFEIRNSRLASTLLRQFIGYSLERKIHEFNHWASEFEKFPLYFMTFHGQQPLKLVMEAIEHAQYVHDINHVIIDNLQFMMGISATYRTDKFWEQDAIIAAFRSFATKHNVHVTLVMHPRKERDSDELTTSSVFGTAKATQEADNVYIIQDKRLTSVRGKKYLQIVKNRYSGDLGIMPLEFDKESLSFATNKKKKDKDKSVA